MRHWIRHLLLLLLGPTVALAQGRSAATARIVTEDIPRFWEVFDRAGPGFPAESFQTGYLARGSRGLKDFAKSRIGGAEALAEAVRARPKYYASVREGTLRLREMEAEIRALFFSLERLYPRARFPNVYFLIGRMSAVGTVSGNGLLLGAEMFGRAPGTPVEELGDWHREALQRLEDVPQVVIHELVHFQQPKARAARTLLASALDEGGADFVAELVSGRHLNGPLHALGDANERAFWEEFQGRMLGEDVSEWLYEATPPRPANLGYWMGYRIVRAYYERVPDKRRALRDILSIRDPVAFLAASGYAERFAAPVPTP